MTAHVELVIGVLVMFTIMCSLAVVLAAVILSAAREDSRQAHARLLAAVEPEPSSEPAVSLDLARAKRRRAQRDGHAA